MTGWWKHIEHKQEDHSFLSFDKSPLYNRFSLFKFQLSIFNLHPKCLFFVVVFPAPTIIISSQNTNLVLILPIHAYSPIKAQAEGRHIQSVFA